VRFSKRERHIGLKFYVNNSGGAVSDPFSFRRLQLGFKWDKIGQV